MPTLKEEIIEFIHCLPDDVDIDDIMEELYFRIKVDQGLKDIAEGKIVAHDEVKAQYKL